MTRTGDRITLLTSLMALTVALGQAQPRALSSPADSSARIYIAGDMNNDHLISNSLWGIDILISTQGFGLGGFYRREVTPDLSAFLSLSISEAKDEREFEQFDPYYQTSYIPGKLNRFIVIPLMAGIQFRLFRDDIVDTFRPYVNAAVGPAMIYTMPYVDLVQREDGGYDARDVDYFKSIGRGSPTYTASAYIGLGANFGTQKSSMFGVNFRYYFTYLFGDGLPSLYRSNTREVSGLKRDFGGFFITLNVGMGF